MSAMATTPRARLGARSRPAVVVRCSERLVRFVQASALGLTCAAAVSFIGAEAMPRARGGHR
jgi:hypothetical protein